MKLAATIAMTAAVSALVLAADVKVDLSKETVGRPPAAFTALSRYGPSCLHGPHQGAQKSTNTGICERSRPMPCPRLPLPSPQSNCRSC